MSCGESDNVICKHVLATKTFYVDLNTLPIGVTVVSATAQAAEDASLIVEAIEVVQADTTIETATAGCQDTVLYADRAVLVKLSGGAPTGEETPLVVTWTQSDGDVDSLDCRVLITGSELGT